MHVCLKACIARGGRAACCFEARHRKSSHTYDQPARQTDRPGIQSGWTHALTHMDTVLPHEAVERTHRKSLILDRRRV